MSASGSVKFGSEVQFPTNAGNCIVVVKFTSKGKVDKKEADGKDDAHTTWKGRAPAEIEINLSWKEIEPTDQEVCDALYQISPRGPNSGKAWDFTVGDGRDAKIHNAPRVVIEDLDGPVRSPGKGEATAKIKCSSWTQPTQANGPGKATTPTDPQKWKGGSPYQQGSGPTTTVQGFGGDPNNKVTFPGNVPTVKP